ncbi:bifunctional ADP-dependent NAD(P)H-hydrate dehydratase/NAD(P)H-hydrate epimerase [Methylovulum miyakonense]|uniref:bifunctional ADP-dependent NAD(P)H-hydrate dehydratase/NAD(P)H-hydrate epimerase n=1 Tax=Methylovulum miyakonense TaxID=645578 RepID=UPI00038230A6|nr:bifunctional ADP-dependent NAD(P)H-hydrate dehydratase/NAD(P)H-hydrate epimerase [Methylovulum miyakonense]
MQTLPITLYTTKQIQELEDRAIYQCGISGFELMGKAGYEVFKRLQDKWRDSKYIAVFCGSGNNAGDGYIVACLALSEGFNVHVYTMVNPEGLKGDALKAYQKYIAMNGTVMPFNVGLSVRADVIVDALFGTGLDRPVLGDYLSAIRIINKSQANVISVDIPSGLNADTGRVMGEAVKANCTVTFIALKQGLFTGDAADYCGEIFYSALTVPADIFQEVPSTVYRVMPRHFPRRKRGMHKGDNGHVLIIGGELGFSGAVMLAGEAALRVGAGLVSVATRRAHTGLMTVNRPELMCHGVDNSDQLTVLLEKANVIVIGPGLGQSDWAKDLLLAVIDSRKLSIIDADALNILSKIPAAHNNLVLSPYRSILTPHVGEAARLMSLSTTKIQQDRFAVVKLIQKKYGGIAILKGSGTLIASEEDIAVSGTGNPGMASGGMGDALSGVIAGLLAQGFPLKDAAQQGVYIHGQAADLAVEQDGERGLLASDLMPYLRRLVNQ